MIVSPSAPLGPLARAVESSRSAEAAVPDWFARRRAAREARAAADAVKTADAETAAPFPVRRAVVSFVASLTVHLLLLISFSLIALHVTRGSGTVSTELGIADETGDELLDTRAFEISGGAETVAEIVPPVTTLPSEFEVPPVDLVSPTPDLAGVADGVGKDDRTAEGTGSDDKFEMPAGGNAVRSGSFTAWTVPEDPKVGQDYIIVIEVSLPDGTEKYARNDLSGTVVGTDGYLVAIPDGREYNGLGWSRPRRLPVFRRAGEKARMMLFVRGARERLVTDTITIRSDLLGERQKLEIVF